MDDMPINLNTLVERQFAAPEPTNPFDWMEDFTMSLEEASELSDPEFIIPGLIVAGHLIVVPAPPNGGKTTIFLDLSADMVKRKYQVIYINADISAGDAKGFIETADEAGIKLLLPDMKVGKSMRDIVSNLERMNNTAVDLSKHVFVFDTFKKMCDVINKRSAKSLLGLLRSMTAKGGTVILLAHTNKYNDSDGKPIYEGTGDLRSDVDELIYLIPEKHPDGSMTVSVEPDKTRAQIERMTFRISPDRQVTRLEEFEDVAQRRALRLRMELDQEAIERITEAIEANRIKQCDIIEFCAEHGVSKRKVVACLKHYAGGETPLWKVERGLERNTKFYHLA
ncbi:AAA family ATPase [Pseudohongiella sp.]|uniref:Uncharacterized protein n=1 Tax=marine sediment metagenome TaxID=412755 RepID=A0A0F9W5I4_9ZZZZ|nr:AAA family ATPase [Pseudohongiella sp.]